MPSGFIWTSGTAPFLAAVVAKAVLNGTNHPL